MLNLSSMGKGGGVEDTTNDYTYIIKDTPQPSWGAGTKSRKNTFNRDRNM